MYTQAVGGEDFTIDVRVLGGLAADFPVAIPVLDPASGNMNVAVPSRENYQLNIGHEKTTAECLCQDVCVQIYSKAKE